METARSIMRSNGYLSPFGRAKKLVANVLPFDVRVGGEYAQRSRIGAKLVVGVTELRAHVVVHRVHAVELRADLVIYHGIELVEVDRPLVRALAEHEEDGTLDVVARLEPACGLRPNGPRGGNLESRCPENHAEVGPDPCILVGKHDHLQTVVRHVRGEIGVDVHHAVLELFVRALYCQGRPAVGIPIGEEAWKVLFVPGEKKVCELVVVDGIRVGRIGDPQVGRVVDGAGVGRLDVALRCTNVLRLVEERPCCRELFKGTG